MPDTIIENPILNSPYREPDRHFRFDDEGITERGRRDPAVELLFRADPPAEEEGQATRLRHRMDARTASRRTSTSTASGNGSSTGGKGEYQGVTHGHSQAPATLDRPRPRKQALLLPDRSPRNAHLSHRGRRKVGDNWIENWLREANDSSNPGLNRVAMKMATGSGKTVVMAMLIAWHALNKLADPKDPRFSDTFLIVTPGSRSATGSACSCPTTPRTTTGCATSSRPT